MKTRATVSRAWRMESTASSAPSPFWINISNEIAHVRLRGPAECRHSDRKRRGADRGSHRSAGHYPVGNASGTFVHHTAAGRRASGVALHAAQNLVHRPELSVARGGHQRGAA